MEYFYSQFGEIQAPQFVHTKDVFMIFLLMSIPMNVKQKDAIVIKSITRFHDFVGFAQLLCCLYQILLYQGTDDGHSEEIYREYG